MKTKAKKTTLWGLSELTMRWPLRKRCLNASMFLASPQTSFGVRLSRIHFSVGEKWMRDKRTPKDVCGEATMFLVFIDFAHFRRHHFLLLLCTNIVFAIQVCNEWSKRIFVTRTNALLVPSELVSLFVELVQSDWEVLWHKRMFFPPLNRSRS